MVGATRTFLRVIDPADDSTGGGSAMALAGAMAAALVGMVSRISIGKVETIPESFYREVEADARRLADELLAGADEDARAFDRVLASYRLPRATEAERAERSKAIQAALLAATRLPLANAERCWRVLELHGRLAGRFNLNAASDLECAGLLARAGVLGCLANVAINLPGLKDRQIIEQISDQARALRAWAGRGEPPNP